MTSIDTTDHADERMKASDFLQRSGATYRQIDYWCRIGLLKMGEPGSGVHRIYTPEDLRVATVIRRLAALGCPVGRMQPVAEAVYGLGVRQVPYVLLIEPADVSFSGAALRIGNLYMQLLENDGPLKFNEMAWVVEV